MKRQAKEDRPRSRRPAKLSELETDLMQVLWEHGEATATEVRQAVAPVRKLAPTTVITLLDRLCDKGVVARLPGGGRPKRYHPVVKPSAIASRLLESVRRRFFGGSSASLFAHLLSSGDVDERELEEIRKLVARR